MSEEQSRKDFEAWRSPTSIFNGEQYVLPETDACIGQAKMDQAAWEAWQASRAALESQGIRTKP